MFNIGLEFVNGEELNGPLALDKTLALPYRILDARNARYAEMTGDV